MEKLEHEHVEDKHIIEEIEHSAHNDASGILDKKESSEEEEVT